MKKVTRTKSSTLVKSSGEAQSYSSWIADLKLRYRATQIKAAVAVNSALIEFYWNLGKDISEKYPGKKRNIAFFANLSRDLCSGMSDIRGLSERNIRYSLAFYELYGYLQQVVADNELIVPQSVEQSDRYKCVTPKVPQSVANCYRPQVVDDNGQVAYLQQVVADNGVIVQQLVAQLFFVPWCHH